MKIRLGFVSNSSSSSFVVGFSKDAVPKSAEEMQRLLFGDEKMVGSYDQEFTTEQAAQRIFDDLCVGQEMTYDELCDRMANDASEGPDYDDYVGEIDPQKDRVKYDKAYNDYTLDLKKFGADMADKLMIKHPDLVFYFFRYADENGPFESVLEHGDVFINAPYSLQISEH